ncbi:DUF3349 domain-containing protein [Mycobacterium sp. MBM]|nr:DUF3349 domain-containing protein [Mycobacterium sp. MBM]
MAGRICTTVAACAEWMRAGYPTGTPRNGHSALLALNGPISLTPGQKRCVTAELESTAEVTAIQVAITKATGRLPTPSQTSEVVGLLQRRSADGQRDH